MTGQHTTDQIQRGQQFVLRLPPGLRERVKQAADANRRSMNAEMVLYIERGVDQQQPEAKGNQQ
jgi:hypothetical protein